MHEQRFPEGRSTAGTTFEIQRRFHVDKWQRYELGETAGLLLQTADPDQMTRPVDRCVDMSVHDCGCGVETDVVRVAHDLQPLFGVDLVGTQDGPHFVIQYLGCGSRQGAEPRVLQLLQERLEIDTESRGALPHFQGRECVDMHLRHRFLHGLDDVDIGLTGVLGVNATLHTDLGAAAIPRFLDSPLHLLRIEIVGPTAQVLG